MNPDTNAGGINPTSTYTVVSGDNLYDIALTNKVSLQAIEQANPQIANFDVIQPGDVINLPVAGAAPVPEASATPVASAPASGSTYTVMEGDNLYNIAGSHGMSLQDMEKDNSQIANFDVIHPGEVINLSNNGSGSLSTDTATPSVAPVSTSSSPSDSSQQPVGGTDTSGGTSSGTVPTPIPVTQPSGGTTSGGTGGSDPSGGTSGQPTGGTPIVAPDSVGSPGASVSASGDTTTGLSDNTPQGIFAQGGGAISGFPSTSSYPFTSAGDEVEAATAAAQANQQVQGWADSAGTQAPDVAKTVFEVDTHPNTDPLKIDEKK